MPDTSIKSIAIEDVVFDLSNPRYPPRKSQRDAIAKIVERQGKKLVRLAEDIVDKGLNPTKRILVGPADGGGFVVLEGNRRIAALKLLVQDDLRSSLALRPGIEKRLRALSDMARAEGKLPTKIECVVMSREEANYWIQLEHTGENSGVGVVTWDGPAKQRFRGGSPALQAVDLVASYLDEETQELLPRIAHTNIARLINTPEARQALGVDINNGMLTLKEPEALARARLAAVVSDVAHGRIKVTQLDEKKQRVAYAQEVAARSLKPLDNAPGKTGVEHMNASAGVRSTRRVATQRRALIPKHVKLSIKQVRINRIYDELQRLSLKDFSNSGAVLLRVFVELSVDEYAKRHSLKLRVEPHPKPGSTKAPRPRDMSLKEKLKTVLDHLETNATCTKQELFGTRALLQNKSHPLSVESLHAYVHNQHYSPTIENLTNTWDNIEAFVAGLWKA